jgi:hypothetical protein
MRYSLVLLALLGMNLYAVETVQEDPCAVNDCKTTTQAVEVDNSQQKIQEADEEKAKNDMLLAPHRTVVISVVGQGVAPVNTTSPAQAYALAKRAAIADGYRLIAEKIKGVEVEGQDLIRNMMVKRSSVRTAVYALVKNANVTDTTFRDGLCEVEMEIRLSYDDIAR